MPKPTLNDKQKYIRARLIDHLKKVPEIESTAVELLFPKHSKKVEIRNVVRSMIRSKELLTKSKPFRPSRYRLAKRMKATPKKKVINALNS
jgi:hypothetical protein